jgi:hypothetical protein
LRGFPLGAHCASFSRPSTWVLQGGECLSQFV